MTFASGIRTGYLPQIPPIRSRGDSVGCGARQQRRPARSGCNGISRRHGIDRRQGRARVSSSYGQHLGMGLRRPPARIAHSDGIRRLRRSRRPSFRRPAQTSAIVRLVIAEPDFLLLDEPTNHLDIATIEWLEGYLKRSKATLLMVTHDRYFLDRVCSKIIEFDNADAYIVEGNYDMYLRRRAERISHGGRPRSRPQHPSARAGMDEPSASGTRRQSQIPHRQFLRPPRTRQSTARAREHTSRNRFVAHRVKIFEAVGVCKRFGDKVILDDFTYTFARGEKLGIVGVNGVGKSTFIKLLQGLIPADSGEWNLGETVRFGYYSQDGLSFDPSKKVIDAVTELAEDIELKQGVHLSPMQYLQRFLFSPPDQQKYIHTLSGGERCRLHLAVVLMAQPNFLILDEPTNDLDIITWVFSKSISRSSGAA